MSTASRLVSAPWFRWMAGMQAATVTGPVRVCGFDLEGKQAMAEAVLCSDYQEGYRPFWRKKAGLTPDLSDPATMGCVRVLLREQNVSLDEFHRSDGARLYWANFRSGTGQSRSTEVEAVNDALDLLGVSDA